MGDHRVLCKRCLQFKWLKARGLCETCWKEARSSNFEHYPIKSELPTSGVCRCREPIPERLPIWDVDQCKRCGKKVL